MANQIAQQDQMGALLTDTTEESPEPELPRADPIPDCAGCTEMAASYDAENRHMSLQVPSGVSFEEDLDMDVIVVAGTGSELRRFTPSRQDVIDLKRGRPADWFLPRSAPRAPTSVFLVFTFTRDEVARTAARRVPMGPLLQDTTTQSPAPQLPPLDPIPDCAGCELIEAVKAIYDPEDEHLRMSVPSLVFAYDEHVDVNVVVAGPEGTVRRYTPSRDDIDALKGRWGADWYLPGAPRAPSAVALVFMWERNGKSETGARWAIVVERHVPGHEPAEPPGEERST